MNDRILFSETMVKALLAGHKTETRRIVKLPSWSTGDWDDFELDEYGKPMAVNKKTDIWTDQGLR